MYNENIEFKGDMTMKNYIEENKRINEELKKLYEDNTEKFLELWKNCFEPEINKRIKEFEPLPKTINDFGIVDTKYYDTDNGILVIGKETRGWNYSLRNWLNTLAVKNVSIDKNDETKHPKMWYNIGRWAKLIHNPNQEISNLAFEKKEALSGLSYIAFTNINKLGGFERSGKSYQSLLKESFVVDMIIKEIEIIKPKFIVLCGINKDYFGDVDKSIKIVKMPHPSAMKSTEKMLQQLKEQL